MDSPIIVVIWLILTIASFVIYHKIFDVTYFGSGGCLKELLTVGFIGMILTMVALEIWYIVAIILIIIGIVSLVQKGSPLVLIIMIVVSVFLGIAAYQYENKSDTNSEVAQIERVL